MTHAKLLVSLLLVASATVIVLWPQADAPPAAPLLTGPSGPLRRIEIRRRPPSGSTAGENGAASAQSQGWSQQATTVLSRGPDGEWVVSAPHPAPVESQLWLALRHVLARPTLPISGLANREPRSIEGSGLDFTTVQLTLVGARSTTIVEMGNKNPLHGYHYAKVWWTQSLSDSTPASTLLVHPDLPRLATADALRWRRRELLPGPVEHLQTIERNGRSLLNRKDDGWKWTTKQQSLSESQRIRLVQTLARFHVRSYATVDRPTPARPPSWSFVGVDGRRSDLWRSAQEPHVWWVRFSIGPAYTLTPLHGDAWQELALFAASAEEPPATDGLFRRSDVVSLLIHRGTERVVLQRLGGLWTLPGGPASPVAVERLLYKLQYLDIVVTEPRANAPPGESIRFTMVTAAGERHILSLRASREAFFTVELDTDLLGKTPAAGVAGMPLTAADLKLP